MKIVLAVHNLKCGGCASTIVRKLKGLPGIAHVEVEVDKSIVHIESDGSVDIHAIERRLHQLGYPVVNSKNSPVTVARSYISCLVGKYRTVDSKA